MKPIRFFTDTETVWYNLSDYIQLLLDTQTIRPFRPSSLYKRKIAPRSIHDILFGKLKRLNTAYQQHQDGMVYVNWVVFEHLYRFIRPFLVRPDDWTDESKVFRQVQLAIENSKQLHQGQYSGRIADYFIALKNGSPTDSVPSDTNSN